MRESGADFARHVQTASAEPGAEPPRIRDKLAYAPLSPTPAGVHRAYCNDDTGSPRSACEDGARSRLLLAVNHGYVTAYAGEAPSLLERLARSEPPSADLAELASLFVEPTRAEEVSLAKGGGDCGFAMDFSFVDLSPDESKRERVLDAINDNSALCGTQATGSLLTASRRLVFLAKTDDAARTIQTALKQRALEVRFESGAGAVKGSPQQAFDDAMRSAVARAGRAASVELTGRRLSVTVTLAPTEAEKRAMAALLDARALKAKRVARLVESLSAGKLPTAQELGDVGAAVASAN